MLSLVSQNKLSIVVFFNIIYIVHYVLSFKFHCTLTNLNFSFHFLFLLFLHNFFAALLHFVLF